MGLRRLQVEADAADLPGSGSESRYPAALADQPVHIELGHGQPAGEPRSASRVPFSAIML